MFRAPLRFFEGEGLGRRLILSAALIGWALLVATGGATAGVPRGPVDLTTVGHWSQTNFQTGVAGSVNRLLVAGGDLYVAGSFSAVGGVAAGNIARFDGTTWAPLGTGTNNYVSAMAGYQGGIAAGGRFTEAGGAPAPYLAFWNGAAWSAIGGGVNGSVNALVEFNGDLIAGGGFDRAGGVPARGVARWDGSAWHAMGPGFSSGITSLAVYHDSLYAGLTQAWAVPPDTCGYSFVYRWNGTGWDTVGTGTYNTDGCGMIPEFDPQIFGLSVTNDHLYALGQLMILDAHGTGGDTAFWDGRAWNSYPGLAQWDDDISGTFTACLYNGQIVVGGSFPGWPSWPGYGCSIAAFDGTTWQPLGGGILGGFPLYWPFVNSMAEYQGSLYVGGVFDGAGRVLSNGLVRWDGSAWHEVAGGGAGVLYPVTALAISPEGQVAAGPQSENGFDVIPSVILRGKDAWQGLPGEFGNLSCLLSSDDHWVAAGRWWNGSAWVSYKGSTGRSPSPSGPETFYKGDLVGTSEFWTPAGYTSCVIRWDGANWVALDSTFTGSVSALAQLGNGLIAGGTFNQPGGSPMKHVAAWNGAAWTPMGAGTDSVVSAFLPDSGRIWVGGAFRHAGGAEARGLATWDGQAWQGVDWPYRATVNALARSCGLIIAGGTFVPDDGSPTVHLLGWDGSAWTPFPDGPDGPVQALAAQGGLLCVGGAFSHAGGAAAVNYAEWNWNRGSLQVDGFSVVRPPGGPVELSWSVPPCFDDARFMVERQEPGGSRHPLAAPPFFGSVSYTFADSSAPATGADYWLEQVQADGTHVAWFGPTHLISTADSTAEQWPLGRVEILPNPVRSGAGVLQFQLPARLPVEVTLFDITGRRLRIVREGNLGPGPCRVPWLPDAAPGEPLPSGVYLLRLQAGAESRTARLVVVH